MIPHSAARLCNTEVVTVLGGNVVLPSYVPAGHRPCMLRCPFANACSESSLGAFLSYLRAVCYKRMHRSVRAEVVPWVYVPYVRYVGRRYRYVRYI